MDFIPLALLYCTHHLSSSSSDSTFEPQYLQMADHGSAHGVDKLQNSSDSDYNPLSRQHTVSLTPEQYERLFFQPTAAKGDLSKRLGNPTLLGLLGFLVPFSSTMFCLLDFQGASANSLASLTGIWYFYGGMAMVLAGLCEFILGNTYPFVVFTICEYSNFIIAWEEQRTDFNRLDGVHWTASAYAQDPWHPLTLAYGTAAEGAVNQSYDSGQGMYFIVMVSNSNTRFPSRTNLSRSDAFSGPGVLHLPPWLSAHEWPFRHRLCLPSLSLRSLRRSTDPHRHGSHCRWCRSSYVPLQDCRRVWFRGSDHGLGKFTSSCYFPTGTNTVSFSMEVWTN